MPIGKNQTGTVPITIRREIQQVVLAVNALKTQDIPKTVLAELNMLINVNSTPDAVLTDGTDVSVESLLKIVQNFRLVHNANDVQIQSPLWPFYFMNYYDARFAPNYTLNLAAAAGDNFVNLRIPFNLTRAMSPEDTLLDNRNVDKSVAEFNFSSSIKLGGAHANVINSGYVRMFTKEFAQIDYVGRARHDFSFTSVPLPISGDNTIQLPVKGNNQYKRIFLFFRDTTGARSDSQCNHVDLKSGAASWYGGKLDYSVAQEQDAVNYGVTPITGCIILDVTSYGQMTRRLDARMLSELILMINTPNATGSVDIFFEKAIYA